MRRRDQVVNADELPRDLAAGPAPGRWASELEWRRAGHDWSLAHGHGPNGWLQMLPIDVRYAVSALGRAHRRSGGLRPPWAS